MTSPRALYLFCVTRAPAPDDLAARLEALDGFDGATVRALAVGDLLAVLCDVPVSQWVGDDAAERLKEIRWVAPRALLHEDAVSATRSLGPAYPMRFGTIFSDADALSARLSELRPELLDFFARTGDASEWSIKGWLDTDTLGASLSDASDDSPASGAAYLLRKRRERDLRELMDAWIRDRAEELRDLVDPHVRGVVPLATRGATREDDDRGLVLKWAALVPDASLEDLRAVLDEEGADLGAHGLDLELVGPWPAYNFRRPS